MLTPVEPPQVTIEVASVDPESVPGRWRVTWLIRNSGSAPLALEEAWIPHGRFRGDGHVALDAVLSPGASTRLSFSVAAEEPPGTVVENAFLILRLQSKNAGWRVFARMRVEFDARACPRPVVETVSAQSIQ